MPRLIDVWRAVDPEAHLVAGEPSASEGLVRGISRTRVGPPHLPPPNDGHLLIVDGGLLDTLPPARLLAEVAASGSNPAGLMVATGGRDQRDGWPDGGPPILLSARTAAALAETAVAYVADENGVLSRFATELRLVVAEAALADPSPAVAAAEVARRIRRGVAVVADGDMVALVPRPAGRALAARFAAAFSRLFGSTSARAAASRRLRDGMWIHEQRIRPGAAVWVFDDLPMSRLDEVAAEALAVTLRALLRRPAVRPLGPPSLIHQAHAAQPPETLDATLLAVARANGRVAPAARSLGVHRNTVLYRLRIAREQRGIDPRRPDDALRLLRQADRDRERGGDRSA